MSAVLITGRSGAGKSTIAAALARRGLEPGRLDEPTRATGPGTLYVCGGADDVLELADRFTRVFLQAAPRAGGGRHAGPPAG